MTLFSAYHGSSIHFEFNVHIRLHTIYFNIQQIFLQIHSTDMQCGIPKNHRNTSSNLHKPGTCEIFVSKYSLVARKQVTGRRSARYYLIRSRCKRKLAQIKGEEKGKGKREEGDGKTGTLTKKCGERRQGFSKTPLYLRLKRLSQKAPRLKRIYVRCM